MKAKSMTLKQAETYLKATEYPFSVITIRKAIATGKLKAVMNDAPVPYYTIKEVDLLAWASNAKHHKPGRKTD